MPRLLPALAALTVLAASGCELLVDPSTHSSGGIETTNAATGSGGSSASSGTSSAVGASSSGTGASSGSGTSATGGSGASSGGSTTAATSGPGTSGSGSTGNGSSSSSSGPTSGTASGSTTGSTSTGSSSSTTSGSTTSSTTTGGSTSSTTTTGGSTSSTTTGGSTSSTTAGGSTSSTTTGGSTSSTTTTSGSTTATTTTGGSTSSTTTTGGSTSSTTTGGCAAYGSTGGQARCCGSACIGPLVLAGGTALDGGSTGSTTPDAGSSTFDAGGGSTGGLGGDGGVITFDAGSPMGPDGGYAPSCEFACWSVPDSLASCSSSTSCAPGTDDAYTYPVSSVCPSEVLYDPSKGSVQFARDNLTGIGWQQSPVSGMDWITATSSYCGGSWTDSSLQSAPVHVPTMAELLGLIDFGSAGHVPPELDGGAGQVWSSDESTAATSAFYLDFDTGAFGHTTESTPLQVRCAVGVAPTGYFTPYDYCPGDGSCTLTGPNGSLTGLYFLFPGKVTTWSSALTYCQDQVGSFCGEYRLPSYKELATLVNFTQASTGTFIDGLTGEYWSSTPTPQAAGSAMAISISNVDGNGLTVPDSAGFPESTGTSQQVACVRGP